MLVFIHVKLFECTFIPPHDKSELIIRNRTRIDNTLIEISQGCRPALGLAFSYRPHNTKRCLFLFFGAVQHQDVGILIFAILEIYSTVLSGCALKTTHLHEYSAYVYFTQYVV